MPYSLLLHSPEMDASTLGEEAIAQGQAAFAAYTTALQDAGVLVSAEVLQHSDVTTTLRKVVCDPALGRIIAVDGYTSTLWTFDAADGSAGRSRDIPVTSGGRWHLGGYDRDTHMLYLVIETSTREVIEAAMIDATGEDDLLTPLPGYREGVGIIYNPARNEVYIPYDNAASVHAVDFDDGGKLYEIAIPAYGNDASAVDTEKGLLFIGSWAHGEIDVIDLETRRMVLRHPNLGIIPHMFTMAYDQSRGLLYFPKGASAVNGTLRGPMQCAAERRPVGYSTIKELTILAHRRLRANRGWQEKAAAEATQCDQGTQ